MKGSNYNNAISKKYIYYFLYKQYYGLPVILNLHKPMSMQSYVVATPSTTTHAHATDYKVLKTRYVFLFCLQVCYVDIVVSYFLVNRFMVTCTQMLEISVTTNLEIYNYYMYASTNIKTIIISQKQQLIIV